MRETSEACPAGLCLIDCTETGFLFIGKGLRLELRYEVIG